MFFEIPKNQREKKKDFLLKIDNQIELVKHHILSDKDRPLYCIFKFERTEYKIFNSLSSLFLFRKQFERLIPPAKIKRIILTNLEVKAAKRKEEKFLQENK